MSLVENIQKLCLVKGTNIANLQKELGFSNGSIYRWGTNSPSVDKLQKVADYFNTTIDFLLSGESSANKIELVINNLLKDLSIGNEQSVNILNSAKGLSDEQQKELLLVIAKEITRVQEEEKKKAIEIIKSLPIEDRKAIKDML
jgi:transcriptional regulator with XRE-family HTH domain